MEPTVAAPMTFQSPQFVLLAMTIVGVVVISWLVIGMISRGQTATGPYDPAQTLTNSFLGMLWVLIVFIGAVIVAQIVTNGTANTESWAAFTGLMGWVMGVNSTITNSRYGISKASTEKDAIIAQQARTGAVLQDALLDPNIVVTGTGSGAAKSIAPDPPAADGQVQTGTMNVTAQGDVNVTEKDKP